MVHVEGERLIQYRNVCLFLWEGGTMRKSTKIPIVVGVLLLFLCLTALAPDGRAQSTFTGMVKDQSGAVLPGVSVEASSPVLIEKSRSILTDERGGYKIIDLRPGVYALTFTLPGFKTIRREVELASNFTATINVEMEVGAVEETITVAAETPVVDSETNFKAQVLPRDVLDDVPTAHTIQGVGQLVLGAQLSSEDELSDPLDRMGRRHVVEYVARKHLRLEIGL